ncbi:MAG: SRPBCC family protein [Acidimicrobiales bacterium]|nr:SRPBCC family protein [Acidimicrobiales bacterium]
MAELTRQTLDWIPSAPLALTGTGASAASPDAVFAVLADHERWPEWFPNVRSVEVTGAPSGVGATRRVKLPGASVDEMFIAWDPGERWSFTGTAARPRFVTSIVEDCRLTATVDGGTIISYTMYLAPAPLFRPFLKLAAPQIQKSLQTAVGRLGERAAR